MIDNKARLVAFNKMKSYKPMNFIMFISTMSITERYTIISTIRVQTILQYFAFNKLRFISKRPSVKTSNSPEVTHLVATLEAFDVFPNLSL